jgi:plasmid maintenance system antidote protein VapI
MPLSKKSSRSSSSKSRSTITEGGERSRIDPKEFLPAKVHRKVAPHEMLKTLRELQGLSQGELAALTGISQSNLSALESGTRKIGRERAITLARALKVHPAVILFSDYDVNEVA